MVLSIEPVFPQTPRTNAVNFLLASQSTQMDPSLVAPAALVTAGSNGALITSVVVHPETTVTAEKIVLWVQLAGTGGWHQVTSALMTAYTQAATDAQPLTTLIDKLKPNAAIRLEANDVLGVTHHIDQQSSVLAEYTDF